MNILLALIYQKVCNDHYYAANVDNSANKATSSH